MHWSLATRVWFTGFEWLPRGQKRVTPKIYWRLLFVYLFIFLFFPKYCEFYIGSKEGLIPYWSEYYIMFFQHSRSPSKHVNSFIKKCYFYCWWGSIKVNSSLDVVHDQTTSKESNLRMIEWVNSACPLTMKWSTPEFLHGRLDIWTSIRICIDDWIILDKSYEEFSKSST